MSSIALRKPGPAARAPWRYRAYGLSIASQIEFPELAEDETKREPDVVIRLAEPGEVAAPGQPGRAAFGPGGVAIAWPEVAAFLVSQGREIVVDPAPETPATLLRLPLLGPILALLLHQRGMLVLHASAVAAGGGSVVFLGDKGAGKSTTAAALVERGHALLCDDVVGIAFDDGTPRIQAGFPQLKLCDDAVRGVLARDPDELPRLHAGVAKRQHLLDAGFAARSAPAALVAVLERGDTARLEPLSGPEALAALVRFSYPPRLSGQALSGDAGARHLRQCGELVRRGVVKRLVVPADLRRLGAALDLIERAAG